MMKKVMRYPKKGSVILIAIGIISVLLVFLGSFLKSTSSRLHTTKKLGDVTYARELANSLATLSFHYLKNIELKNEGSDLRKTLSMSEVKDASGDLLGGIKGNIKEGGQDVISVLLENSGLNDVKIDKLLWEINKADFSDKDKAKIKLGEKYSPYPREKKGLVRVYIQITHKIPGHKKSITEDYSYAANINVVANLLPVLSKFNLYIEDCFGGDRPSNEKDLVSRFNIVNTSAGGKLNSSSKACPWVLDNGSDDSYYDTYKDFIENKKGLVYLGGGTNSEPVVLGIARGFTDVETGDYGENFHFYKRGAGGYWKTYDVWENEKGILIAEIGLCDDESTSNLQTWQLMFGETYKKQSKSTSIFRLYGTDNIKRSPTLVLGYVDSMCGQVRAYKGSSANEHSFLAYFDLYDDFIAFSGLSTDYGDIGAALQYSGGVLSISKFTTAYCAKNPSFDNSDSSALEDFYSEYKKKYASRIVRNRYNKDYSYILTKEKGKSDDDRAYPLDYCSDLINGDLKKLCEHKEDDLFVKIPTSDNAKYGSIYSEVNTLDELKKFLNKDILYINGSDEDSENPKIDRIAHICKISNSSKFTIEDYLKFKNLLIKNGSSEARLDLNGWLYIACDTDKSFEIELEKCNNISQGGLIVDNKGIGKIDVKIKGNIHGQHLTILNLSGDIIIESGVKKVEASLVSLKGQLKINGDSNINNNQKLEIIGNVVMKSLPKEKSKLEENFRRKVIIKYNEDLAAIPYQEDSSVGGNEEKLKRTEFPLLMFDLKEDYHKLD